MAVAQRKSQNLIKAKIIQRNEEQSDTTSTEKPQEEKEPSKETGRRKEYGNDLTNAGLKEQAGTRIILLWRS